MFPIPLDPVALGDRCLRLLPAGLVSPALPRARHARHPCTPPARQQTAPRDRAADRPRAGSQHRSVASAGSYRWWSSPYSSPCYSDCCHECRTPGCLSCVDRGRVFSPRTLEPSPLRGLGLGDGDIISADDSVVRTPTLRSELLGLVGRCDHLLKVNGACMPVEQKPTAHRLQQSHVLLVGVLCLLVQDTYGIRPPYGIVVLAGDHREQVIFGQSLERGVLRTMAQMRRILATGEPAGPRCVVPKCRAYAYQHLCWGSQPARSAAAADRLG